MAPAVQPLPLMLRRVSVALGISLLIAVAGCSGAEEPDDLFGPEGSGGAAGSSEVPATSTDSTTPAAPSPSTGTPPKDEPTQQPAPAPSNPGTNPGTTPTPTPKPTCIAESLDNDEFKNAEAFTSCISGKLSGRDVDFVSIVAPATAKKISIAHSESGNVAYRMFVNGMPMLFPTLPEEMSALGSAKYTFKVEPAGTSTTDREWKLEVSFE